jgi:pyridoxine kinase
MNILSIQSSVAYGHVGNSAAAFALQRLGHEVLRIDTVRFSNHPGHGGFRGGVAGAAELADLVEGLGERGWLAGVDAVLTGYLGAVEQGAVVAAAAARVKAANPKALWALDPVIGDKGRVFVKPGIPEFLRGAAGKADILTPNAFELAYLTGRPCETPAQAVAAAQALRAGAPARTVVVTGLPLADTRPPALATLAVGAAGAWQVTAPLIEHPANGAGDLFAALFLGRYLTRRDLPDALDRATSSVHAVIAHSAAAGARELRLVAAQDELVEPRRRFGAAPVSAAGL